MRIATLRNAVVEALEDKKAKEIVALDVRKLTSLFDYVVIASGESTRQTKALARNVQEKLKDLGAHVYGVEGEQSGEWVLVDLGDIVVHVMQPTVRQYYNLEELWAAAKKAPKPRKAKPVVVS
ncbi:MAG: ribosome silencing factor [Burkholderiales bacterium]|nr:ribosome silencing factor [Pseudomonadota bacterium]